MRVNDQALGSGPEVADTSYRRDGIASSQASQISDLKDIGESEEGAISLPKTWTRLGWGKGVVRASGSEKLEPEFTEPSLFSSILIFSFFKFCATGNFEAASETSPRV
jgi:hypothetical protein